MFFFYMLANLVCVFYSGWFILAVFGTNFRRSFNRHMILLHIETRILLMRFGIPFPELESEQDLLQKRVRSES